MHIGSYGFESLGLHIEGVSDSRSSTRSDNTLTLARVHSVFPNRVFRDQPRLHYL